MAQMPVKQPTGEQLKIEAPKQVNAGETIKVTVKDMAGKPVAGAEVKLVSLPDEQAPDKSVPSMSDAIAKPPVKEPTEKIAKTDKNGVATLKAPEVGKETVMKIEATLGAQKGAANITVLPVEKAPVKEPVEKTK
jgi:Nickel uptake substrate-specific transmembrane region.